MTEVLSPSHTQLDTPPQCKGTHGYIVIIRKDGKDAQRVPLNLGITSECVFGRHSTCDICIRIPTVSRRHAKIKVDEDNDRLLWLVPLSNQVTLLNDEQLTEAVELRHGDVITIGHRQFRYEEGTSFQKKIILEDFDDIDEHNLEEVPITPFNDRTNTSKEDLEATVTKTLNFNNEDKENVIRGILSPGPRTGRRKSVSFAEQLEKAVFFEKDEATKTVPKCSPIFSPRSTQPKKESIESMATLAQQAFNNIMNEPVKKEEEYQEQNSEDSIDLLNDFLESEEESTCFTPTDEKKDNEEDKSPEIKKEEIVQHHTTPIRERKKVYRNRRRSCNSSSIEDKNEEKMKISQKETPVRSRQSSAHRRRSCGAEKKGETTTTVRSRKDRQYRRRTISRI